MYIGTDSEHGLFLNKQLVSAIDRIPGTKDNPYPLPNGGGLQVDNVLLEWNSVPAESFEQFNETIILTLADIHNHIGENMDIGYASSYVYSTEELMHPLANIIGCTPDFSAYAWMQNQNNLNRSKNIKPSLNGVNLRTAAAHIHVSPFNTPLEAINQVLLMDIFLGLPSLFLDLDRVRRQLYGTAGSFRFKKYPNNTRGVEYRVLGSFWTENEVYRRWVFNTTKDIYSNVGMASKITEEDKINIQYALNNYDLNVAKSLMDKFGVNLP
jgi:hypothetical protein